MTKKAYSITEFADTYSIGRSKVFEEIVDGKLKVKKCGGRTLVGVEDAEEWFANLPYGGSEK